MAMALCHRMPLILRNPACQHKVTVVAKECLNAEAAWVAEEIQRGGRPGMRMTRKRARCLTILFELSVEKVRRTGMGIVFQFVHVFHAGDSMIVCVHAGLS